MTWTPMGVECWALQCHISKVLLAPTGWSCMVDLQAAAKKEHVQVCVAHLLREDPVGYATHHSATLAHKRNTSVSAVQQQPAQQDNVTLPTALVQDDQP